MSVFSSARLQNKVVLVTGASAGIGAVSASASTMIPRTEISYSALGYGNPLRKGTFISANAAQTVPHQHHRREQT